MADAPTLPLFAVGLSPERVLNLLEQARADHQFTAPFGDGCRFRSGRWEAQCSCGVWLPRAASTLARHQTYAGAVLVSRWTTGDQPT